ncbi:hypothetical protein BLOT_015111 [Blomia tropicalis]|nr:hypothetical protein BLOT_015111 [Blomia tropicalis]
MMKMMTRRNGSNPFQCIWKRLSSSSRPTRLPLHRHYHQQHRWTTSSENIVMFSTIAITLMLFSSFVHSSNRTV